MPAAVLPAGPTDSVLSQAEVDGSTYHSHPAGSRRARIQSERRFASTDLLS